MHNLAIALHAKGYTITGSDDEIFEPSKTRLAKLGLLPDKEGWFEENIHTGLDAVILGMHAKADNPELLKAKELGVKKIIIPTAGNAGGALAAYAARGGLEAYIFMPKDTPPANIEESRIAGATVILINGLISEAAGMAGEKARSEGWFDVSTFKEPYRCEGKKIMGYELAEAFNWDLPDVIIYPTGGGTGLVGMWKAFKEMDELGWLESKKRPRMVAVQAEGCAPVIKAFLSDPLFCDFWIGAQTIASGLRVPKSFADQIILHDLRESQGTA